MVRVAMRVGSNNPNWLLSDHLGSQLIVAGYDGLTEEGKLRYKAWGETRFTSADSIIHGAGQVQAWDRYAAMGNNPVRYVDPTGHMQACLDGDEGGGCGHGANKCILNYRSG